MSVTSVEPTKTPNKSVNHPTPVITVSSLLKRQRTTHKTAPKSHLPVTTPSNMKQTQLTHTPKQSNVTVTMNTTDSDISSMSKLTLAHLAERAAKENGHITKASHSMNFNIPRLQQKVTQHRDSLIVASINHLDLIYPKQINLIRLLSMPQAYSTLEQAIKHNKIKYDYIDILDRISIIKKLIEYCSSLTPPLSSSSKQKSITEYSPK